MKVHTHIITKQKLIINHHKINTCALYFCAEPSYSSFVQLSQSVATFRPLLHRPSAFCSPQGAVPGDPHALHYHQVSLHMEMTSQVLQLSPTV